MSNIITVFDTKAIYLISGGEASYTGETFEDIEWLSGYTPTFTTAEVKAKAATLQAEYDANAYARSRKTAYNALNQLELISDDAINGTTTHADAILAIKAEFPKPV